MDSPLQIESALREARAILSRCDGIHQLHSDAAALQMIAKCAQLGIAIDLADVERILERMRRAAAIRSRLDS